MDSKQYEYVIAIAEEKNLLRAAERIYVSSSALSQALKKIESDLGADIFVRNKSGFVLTDIGEMFLELAYNVVRKEDATIKTIHEIVEGNAKKYVIGLTPGRGTKMFSEIYGTFKEKYSKIKILLIDGTAQELSKMLKRGVIDLGFFPSEMADDSMETTVVARESLMLAVPTDHYLTKIISSMKGDADYATVNLDMFKNEEFMLMKEGTSVRSITDKLFNEAGFNPKVCFEASSMVAIDDLSKKGYGIAFVQNFYACKDNPDAKYYYTVPMVTTNLCAVHSKETVLTPSQKYLIELARDYFAKRT